ncbi:translation initiation factor eIF-2B subunit epsilon [Trypanosoma theileri]|uniref:Translation initiation factor eIF-2B subunit epsilon n=1 Tax=Trypanosoma theileri TaxID=67003 RepID=A0A1X0NQS4_9TRYP|nr:translation initiation factor eIF-2B subunit epsilon [Trypanosoma theileri]ORC87037.1 translation initiation factor eIF-2B subunit epsilon [Trypanosoma theileri]
MDLAATRRTTETGRKRHGPHFTVIIIGEVFNNSTHPLYPVSPSQKLPFALLPICNTPIIDYILENLVENGVDEVCILLNSESVEPVRDHLQNNRTARGKPWLESKDMKVKVVESKRNMTRPFDATSEIVDHNLVAQNSSFLFVPIDSMAFFTNLRDLFHIHNQRTNDLKKYAATLLCTSVRSLLEDTLHDLLLEKMNERDNNTLGSPLLDRDSPATAGVTLSAAEYRPLGVYENPPNHLTMFTLQKSTGVVRSMTRVESREESPEAISMEFSSREPMSVRTDLVPTNYLFCSAEALPLFTFHMNDLHAFLVDLLVKEELWGNVFGIEEVTPSMGIIQPINSLTSYIQTNIDVCCRRFFPLTRESSFAEDLARYAVSPHCQSVYLHQVGAKVLSSNCEPCVVVGEQVVIPPTAIVRGTIFGKGVRIGDGAVISGCVILDGTTIGSGCVLRHSFIGHNVVISEKAEVSHSIIGDGCIIGVIPIKTSSSRAGTGTGTGSAGGASGTSNSHSHSSNSHRRNITINSTITTTTTATPKGKTKKKANEENVQKNVQGVVIEDQVIIACSIAETDKNLTGQGGCGKAVKDRYVSTTLPTREVFIRDTIPRATSEAADDDDSDDDNDSAQMELFRDTIHSLVEQALRQPSRIKDCTFQMKNTRLTFGRNNGDLCQIVTEKLLLHAMERHGKSGDVNFLLKAVRDLFAQWCRPFYSDVVTGSDEMQATLQAVCMAVGDVRCPLHKSGPLLLECLYNDCDDDLYDERGFCIVSGESLVEFGAYIRRVHQRRAAAFDAEDSDGNESDEEEERMLRVGLSCEQFIAGVREFLEEEEDDEEE